MQNMLKHVRAKFSPYVNEFENKADTLLEKKFAAKDADGLRAAVLALMQEDAVALAVWCERQYKGYASLTKEVRTQLYENLKAIKSSFQSYSFMQVPDEDALFLELYEKEIPAEELKARHRQIQYLKQIMEYFRTQIAYEPQKGHNIGALLKNPKTGALIGDSHQVVLLYLYLYALKYDVSDLRIKITATKMYLHFEHADIDLEQGVFVKYTREICEIVPVTEALVLNLLDTPKESTDALTIAPTALSRLGEFARLLSNREEIISQNSKIAFRKHVLHQLEQENFDSAMSYAMESKDLEAVQHVAIKATAYYLKKDDFIEAHRYAKHTKDPEGIAKKIYEKEGIAFFNKKNYIRAGEKFKNAENHEYLKKCYAGLFFQEQAKIKHIKLLSELKQNKKTILQMKLYAEKSEDQKLVAYTQGLLDQISGKHKKK